MPSVITCAVVLAALMMIAATTTQTHEAFDVVSVKSMGPASGEALARFGTDATAAFHAWKAGGLLLPWSAVARGGPTAASCLFYISGTIELSDRPDPRPFGSCLRLVGLLYASQKEREGKQSPRLGRIMLRTSITLSAATRPVGRIATNACPFEWHHELRQAAVWS